MAADPEFAAWMQDVKQAVASIRATANEKESSKRDKRLDHVLPMQFEHQGKLHWGYLASRKAMWSAFTELGVYLCVALAVVFGIVRDWIPPWLWIALAVVFAITWIASRVYRRLERPAQQFREQMEVVPGVLVYANTVLYEPGPQPASNAGILFTFDETLGADPERMQELAKRCAELHDKATRARPGEEELQRRAVGWSEDRPESSPHVFDRVQVPKSICGNDQTFFTLVSIARTDLPDGVIDRRFYPLLARRGRNESVALVPASVWAGGTAT